MMKMKCFFRITVLVLLTSLFGSCHTYDKTPKNIYHSNVRMEKLIDDLTKQYKNVYYRSSQNSIYGWVWVHVNEGILLYEIDPVSKIESKVIPRNHAVKHVNEVFDLRRNYPYLEGADIIGFKTREQGEYLDVSLPCELYDFMKMKFPESDVLSNQLQTDYSYIVAFLKAMMIEDDLQREPSGPSSPFVNYENL